MQLNSGYVPVTLLLFDITVFIITSLIVYFGTMINMVDSWGLHVPGSASTMDVLVKHLTDQVLAGVSYWILMYSVDTSGS